MADTEDYSNMSRALVLAGKGRPSPNPYVGAVIVKGGKVIGEGYHHQAGKDHAEVDAIKQVYRKFGAPGAKKLLSQSTLFVTLEPCAHFGRVPPCTEAILREKIGTVVFAMIDPNPKVKGNGERILRKNGVKVRMLKGAAGQMLAEQALELNRAFAKHIRTGLPYVTLKMAMTLDGKVATHTNDSKWVGGAAELKMVQHLRDKVGAVLVGVGTVMNDNPRLTCRLKGGHDPLRVITDATLKMPADAKVLKDSNVLIGVGAEHDMRKAKLLAKRGIRHVLLPQRTPGHVSLKELMRHLGRMGIDHVMCEGGAEMAGGLVEDGLVDEILFFIAPKIVGGRTAPGPVGGEGIAKMSQAKKVRIVSVEPVGEDWLVRAKMN